MEAADAVKAQQSPEQILVAVANGDRTAFRDLYEVTSPALFPVCLRILRDRDLAMETFQDAFFRIWQKAHLYDPAKGSALAWMVTVTRRCALDRLAKSNRNMVPLEDLEEGLLVSVTSGLGAGSVESVALKKCLERLEDKYAQAVLMAYCFGLTHHELAAKLSVPLGTAKSWVTRGLSQLQDCMGQ